MFIVWSQCVLQCFNSLHGKTTNVQKYLVTIFFSEWGYCVYIEISLRLSPSLTFRALKKCYTFLIFTFVMLAWNRKGCDLSHGRYHSSCFCNIINLFGDMATVYIYVRFLYSCYSPSNHLHELQV